MECEEKRERMRRLPRGPSASSAKRGGKVPGGRTKRREGGLCREEGRQVVAGWQNCLQARKRGATPRQRG